MPRAASASSSPSSSASHRSRRLRYTRDQLLKSLEILGPLSAPIPPDLPPSPPASRATSPAPGSKRKSESHRPHSPSKKPRTSSLSDHPRPPPAPSLHPVAGPSNYSSEDGELREDIPASRGAVAFSNVPVRRPRRGGKLPHVFFDELYDKYHGYGRMLKYSGDVRMLSTFPPKSASFRALPDPPAVQSAYHKFGSVIARLELIDALVDFAYAIWAKDYSRGRYSRGSALSSMEAFLVHCKRKWEMEDNMDDREKALIGLIWMIEGFVHGRQIQSYARMINGENNELAGQLQKMHKDELAAAAAKEAEAVTSMATPPMLPSPASITTSSSANSTPTGRVSSGAPAATKTAADQTSSSSSSAAKPPGPEQKKPDPPPSHIKIPVGWSFIAPRKWQSSGLVAAAWCMSQSQQTLTLPLMAKHFPRTFARMVFSSFAATDEHEPDIEDDDGELFWPGQCVTGQGLGWVCTMGKAMIKEFGREFGYRGIEGVIPKPETEGADGEAAATPAGVPIHASTPVPFQEGVDGPR